MVNFELLLTSDTKQIILAAAVGFIFGLERELRGKAASIRTFSLITIGSCLFALLSIKASGSQNGGAYDVTRIAAQIVSGIGFIGAGVIFKGRGGIEGITTAALMWLCAALGMACGFYMNDLVFATVLVTCVIHIISGITYRILFFYRDTSSEKNN